MGLQYEKASKIGVTGATGQVGREVVTALQSRNIPHCALSRSDGFDFTQPNSYSLIGLKRIFLVCNSSVAKSIPQFLENAKKAGVRQIVLMSGIGADQNKQSFLAEMERVVEDSHIPFVALRGNWFFQNFGSHFKSMIAKDHVLTFPDGGASISFVDARDIAEVALHFLTQPIKENEAYDITGPESLTHKMVADLFSKHLPYNIAYQEITEEEAKTRLGWNEEWLSLFSDIRLGLTSPVSGAVEKLLGKAPRCFEDYILENRSIWLEQ